MQAHPHYDPTRDYKLPIDNETWMKNARQAMKEKLLSNEIIKGG